MEKNPAANPVAGAGHGAGVKVHSEAGVCVELPARSCGYLESRFPEQLMFEWDRNNLRKIWAHRIKRDSESNEQENPGDAEV